MQRSGFFAAGVGHEAGSFIDNHLDDLLSALVWADISLQEGDVDAAIQAAIEIVEKLRTIHPFSYPEKDVPPLWTEVMGDWIMGTALSKIVQRYGENVVGFVQQGIVYHLVWGVEAIRVHATAVGRPEVTQLSGILALAMTYGMPSVPAAVLVKAGLPSRVMAMELVTAFPAAFGDEVGLREWLPGVIRALETDIAFWPDPETKAIWRDFAQRWHNSVNASWVDSDRRYRVRWLNEAPPAGMNLRLLDNYDTGGVDVCGMDLTILGHLLDRLVDETTRGHFVASVHTEPHRIILHRFGPGSTF